MSDQIGARIHYLLLFPHTAPAAGLRHPPSLTKAPPYFLELDIELTDLGRGEVELDGERLSLRREVMDGEVQLVEAVFDLPDALDPAANQRRQGLQRRLRERLLGEAGYRGAFYEEYVIVCLAGGPPRPDEFVEANLVRLAPLLRSGAHTITEAEARKMLISRARFAGGDLTIVDWDGALVIDPEGDVQSEIALLKIANYQLLSYRLLDRAIERNLEQVRQELAGRRRFRFTNRVLRAALEQRLEFLLDFERTEQRLLLIGDWYTAQLARLIVDEFYLDEWKAAISHKLDLLENVTDTIRENFTLSWQQFLDLVQLAGWLILLVGYFVLFYFDVLAAGG